MKRFQACKKRFRGEAELLAVLLAELLAEPVGFAKLQIYFNHGRCFRMHRSNITPSSCAGFSPCVASRCELPCLIAHRFALARQVLSGYQLGLAVPVQFKVRELHATNPPGANLPSSASHNAFTCALFMFSLQMLFIERRREIRTLFAVSLAVSFAACLTWQTR